MVILGSNSFSRRTSLSTKSPRSRLKLKAGGGSGRTSTSNTTGSSTHTSEPRTHSRRHCLFNAPRFYSIVGVVVIVLTMELAASSMYFARTRFFSRIVPDSTRYEKIDESPYEDEACAARIAFHESLAMLACAICSTSARSKNLRSFKNHDSK